MRQQRRSWFLVVLVLIFPGRIFSQQQLPRIAQNSPHTLIFFGDLVKKELQNGGSTKFFFNRNMFVSTTDNLSPIQIMRAGTYTSTLPFFCKKEFQFEKNTSVPLRVRLGSLEYVNKMERKK
jgi:hypothetical protein